MEGLPIAALGVHECDERVDHEVDRNDVGAPGVGQHHRREPGQACQLGQYAEEVVGPVDLVHLTGARVADDDRRPVDAVLQPLRRADQQFGLELRLVIRRGQILRHVEVVLGELAPVGACDRDRRHVVQRRVEAEGEVDDRPGALDVGGALVVLGGGHVVDGGAVHDMIDGAQFGDGVVGQPEARGGEVADQRFSPLAPGVIAVGGEPLEPAEGLAPDQNPHFGVIAVRQDLGHHAPANKPSTAGNDILHASHGHPWPGKRQCCVSSDTSAKGASMPLDPNAIGAKTEPQLFKWTDRDTMLYALGVGAGLDDLAFTTENSHDTPQQVLPTYAVIACLPFAAAAMIGSFNFAMLLHGSQGIRLFKPLPAGGQAERRRRGRRHPGQG